MRPNTFKPFVNGGLSCANAHIDAKKVQSIMDPTWWPRICIPLVLLPHPGHPPIEPDSETYVNHCAGNVHLTPLVSRMLLTSSHFNSKELPASDKKPHPASQVTMFVGASLAALYPVLGRATRCRQNSPLGSSIIPTLRREVGPRVTWCHSQKSRSTGIAAAGRAVLQKTGTATSAQSVAADQIQVSRSGQGSIEKYKHIRHI